MLYPQPSDAREFAAFATALPAAGLAAGAMFYLLRPLRRGGLIARFIARVAIIGMLYTTLQVVAVAIGGPYIFAGPMRGGGWRTDPTSGREILGSGLALGVIGALLWPAVARAKGEELGM
jgi:uncharacterized membrane protein